MAIGEIAIDPEGAMRRLVTPSDVTSLLRRPPPPTPRMSSRERAATNQLECLKQICRFGHATTSDLASVVWRGAKFARQMSQRTIAALVREGLVSRRLSALGTPCYVLTRPGAAFLEVRDIPARHGLDLNVAGSGYRHHAITTRFVIEMEAIGYRGWHEYAIAQGTAPLTQNELLECYGKLPDALLIRKSTGQLFVCETEGAAKSNAELSKACAIVSTKIHQRLHRDHQYVLGGLMFAFDKSLNHAGRIARVASARWRELPTSVRRQLGQNITLCRLSLSPPLVFSGLTLDPLIL